MHPTACSDAVADVLAAVAKARADERLLTSPEMLLADLEGLLVAQAQLQALVVRRLRSAHHLEVTVELAGRSTKRWLVEDQRLAGAEAARLLRLVHQLPANPAAEDAFDDGRITAQHAAAITSSLQALPPELRPTVAPMLVERAEAFPPEEIAGFTDELLERLGVDTDADFRRERRHAARGLDVASTLDGAVSLSGTLTPDVAVRFHAALRIAAAKAGAEDERTPRQRRHDAIGVMADAYLARQGQPSFAGAPRSLIATMDYAELRDQLGERCLHLAGGERISAGALRRLACDAQLIPMVLGGASEVLDVGKAGHEFSVAVRRAAYLRDHGRCAFPRCRNAVDELHHITFRRDGGPNSLDNAAWLCAFHHWLAHEGGWALARDGTTGAYAWSRPKTTRTAASSRPPPDPKQVVSPTSGGTGHGDPSDPHRPHR